MTPVAGSSTTDSGWARPLVSHRSFGAAADAAVLKAIRVAVSATTTGRMVLLARWFGLGLGSGGPARTGTASQAQKVTQSTTRKRAFERQRFFGRCVNLST